MKKGNDNNKTKLKSKKEMKNLFWLLEIGMCESKSSIWSSEWKEKQVGMDYFDREIARYN